MTYPCFNELSSRISVGWPPRGALWLQWKLPSFSVKPANGAGLASRMPAFSPFEPGPPRINPDSPGMMTVRSSQMFSSASSVRKDSSIRAAAGNPPQASSSRKTETA